MLCLTRRVGERIVIDEKITIEVLQVNGNRVRLGVNAPQEMPVDRDEIHEAKKRTGALDRARSITSPTKPMGMRMAAG